MQTTTCPVRAFDKEVEELSRWFALCYDLEWDAMSGLAFWHRIALPADGGAGDQDARLMHALDWASSVHNDIMREAQVRRQRQKAHKKQKDDHGSS